MGNSWFLDASWCGCASVTSSPNPWDFHLISVKKIPNIQKLRHGNVCHFFGLNINWLSDSLFHFQSPAIHSLIFHLWRPSNCLESAARQQGSDPMQASQQYCQLTLLGQLSNKLVLLGHVLFSSVPIYFSCISFWFLAENITSCRPNSVIYLHFTSFFSTLIMYFHRGDSLWNVSASAVATILLYTPAARLPHWCSSQRGFVSNILSR